ncbi:hypothetical protein P3T39_003721 [Kitasatospora sp. GP82]|nr:hypothetical protein [Kitasatospora sp. GP82]
MAGGGPRGAGAGAQYMPPNGAGGKSGAPDRMTWRQSETIDAHFALRESPRGKARQAAARVLTMPRRLRVLSVT